MNKFDDIMCGVGDSGLEGAEWLLDKLGGVGSFMGKCIGTTTLYVVALILVPFALMNEIRKVLGCLILFAVLCVGTDVDADDLRYFTPVTKLNVNGNNVLVVRDVTPVRRPVVTRGLSGRNKMPHNPIFDTRRQTPYFGRTGSSRSTTYIPPSTSYGEPKYIKNPFVKTDKFKELDKFHEERQ